MAISQKKIFWKTKSSRKWSNQDQSGFLLRLAELLTEGFSLSEGLQFMQIVMGKKQNDIKAMLDQMERGDAFSDALRPYGFSDLITMQLQLSILHGNFHATMKFCAEEIETRHKQWQQLIKIAAYPCFLLALTFFMLIAIRQFMLPTLQHSITESNGTTQTLIFYLTYLPQITGTCIGVITLLTLVGSRYMKKKTALEKARFLSRLPVAGKWLHEYYTFFFCREFAYFFLNGQSIHQMVQEMQVENSPPLMQEVAQRMDQELRKGKPLPEIVKELTIFKPEMTWMIYHGEKTSQLGLKLKLFSQECYRQLTATITAKINILQPILFFLIGLLIVLIYLILMLPMLDMMKGAF